MKNCLNCKHCKVVEKFTFNKDNISDKDSKLCTRVTCFECSANQTKQYFMKPVLNCKEYKKGIFILNE